MFRFPCLTLGENRIVLNQPDFIGSLFIAGVGKVVHGLGDGFVGLKTELADQYFILRQNSISVEK
ncbi:hypothetical protein SDC9_178585 [bioreactor metagenome]|uniref:Uncharacterized protein n=1 Tax=bioreactor metagenome TaxID=1076179 RepID=A0A645GW52_9ZZZZ